jgi:REP element-mobilizing transposase RayT
MRTRRYKVYGQVGVYHCITRTVNGERLLEDREKEVLRKMLWQVAAFSGIEILTYCIMSNHFHVLIKVPNKNTVKVSDEELIRRYTLLYPKTTQYQTMEIDTIKTILKNGGEFADSIRKELLNRMHDMSEFMKCLKQRFTIWYNKSNGRFGTLWAERFKSVLIENDKFTKLAVGAYIDLNPIRAGITSDPQSYRFSGYGEAVGGNISARQGIGEILECRNWEQVQESYRLLLYSTGSAPDSKKEGGNAAQISNSEFRSVFNESGQMTVGDTLRSHIKYFTAGKVLGHKDFVNNFIKNEKEFITNKRETVPKSIKIPCLENFKTLTQPRIH